MEEIRDYPVTRISEIYNNHPIFGYPLVQLTGNITYSESVWLLLKGELPNDRELKMLDVLLTSCLDGGGFGGGQTQVARLIATANPDDPMAAIGGAMLAYGGVTGSPSVAAQFISDACELMKRENMSRKQAALKVVADARNKKQRIPGLGHRWYPEGDPRGTRIRECAEVYEFVGEMTLLYDAISEELFRVVSRPMPPNVDGAFAAAGLDLGLEAKSLGPLFALGSMGALIAHVLEELAEPESRSLRRFIDNKIGWKYIGPKRRDLPVEKICIPVVKTKLTDG
ncbi:citrate/2-methylcitrate synthase [Chloroflexota bacterium]